MYKKIFGNNEKRKKRKKRGPTANQVDKHMQFSPALEMLINGR